MKSILPAALCAIATLLVRQPATAAAPDGLVGSLDGSFANISSGGASADLGVLNGAAAFSLGSPYVGAQGNAGYDWTTISGVGISGWNFGGSVFWAAFPGRAGATVQYFSLDDGGSDLALSGNVTTYGAFGEYYFSDFLTAGLKGGGLSVNGAASVLGYGSFGPASGSYFGGALTAYLIPALALSGTVDYFAVSGINGGNVTALSIGAEYLLSEALPTLTSLPVSAFGGYTNQQISGGGGSADIFFVGLRIYTTGIGDTLRDIHRNGTLGWLGSSAPFLQ